MASDTQKLPYDSSSKDSIYKYAVELRGSTLREKCDVEKIADIRQNKGSFGSAVERYYFGLAPNAESAPDFKEAGLELKTTPLRQLKDGRLASKERLVLGMIDYMQVVDESFETSHLIDKAEDVLLVSYRWEPDTDPLDYRVELVDILSFHEMPDDDLVQIKADWEAVVDKVRNGLAHEISGSDTLYLEACTKAATSKDRRRQPYSDIPAKPRAWALKSSYMTAMSNHLLEKTQSISRDASETGMTLIEIVRSRFAPFVGLTEQELGERFGYMKKDARKPKNLCALITRHILGVSDDAKIEEFEKAGIVPKTMRVKPNGTPKESMSFPFFDYFNLVETPYADSNFAQYMEQKYLFVIYREDEGGEYRLSEVVFWQMPEQDVEEAERCYEEMRSRVANGRAQDSVKSSENRCCHVRPHGRDSSDTLPTPQGDRVVKKSFWLNAQYLKGEIERIVG